MPALQAPFLADVHRTAQRFTSNQYWYINVLQSFRLLGRFRFCQAESPPPRGWGEVRVNANRATGRYRQRAGLCRRRICRVLPHFEIRVLPQQHESGR